MLRRPTAILLALTILVSACLLTLPTAAADLDPAILAQVEQRLLDGLAAFKTTIDTSVGGLSGNEFFTYGQAAVNRLMQRHPEYDTEILAGCRMYILGTDKYSMEVDYQPNAAARRAALDATVDALLGGIDPAWDEIGQLLYLHDRIALEYSYDTALANASPYRMIETGKGVCEAYARLMRICLNRLGFANDYAHTDDHIWNIVRLADGAWYHIDVTWDDPIPDRIGQVDHRYFLVSDAGHNTDAEGKPCTFTSPYACTSTRFDAAAWRDSFAPLAFADGSWYMMASKTRTLCRIDLQSGNATETAVTLPVWTPRNDPNSYYTSGFSGLFAHGGLLYYNTPTDICTYDPATGATAVFDTPSTAQGYLCGIAYLDGVLRFGTRNDPYDAGYLDLVNLALPAVAAPTPVEPVEPTPVEPVEPAEPTLTPGTPIGDYLYTNILAYIDGYAIRSYNINWNTYIVVEDLMAYGFGVTWHADERRLVVDTTRTAAPDAYTTTYTPPAVTAPTGSVAGQYLYTEITTWLGETQVEGYNIGGYTCICMDDLADTFAAEYVWDAANSALRLTTMP